MDVEIVPCALTRMNTTNACKRIIAGALLSGSVAVAGIAFTAGTARDNTYRRPTWCGT